MAKGRQLRKIKKSGTKSSSDILEKLDSKVIDAAKMSLYGLLAFNILVIIYTSAIIYYLNKLQECACYQEKNKENYSNISYLIGIESIILAINIIYVIVLGASIYFLNKVKKGGAENNNIMIYIVLLLNIVLYSYFVYYVYKIYQNVSSDCECTQNWLRYLLYIQTVFMAFYIIIMLYNLFSKF
jgi:hypothetical protein